MILHVSIFVLIFSPIQYICKVRTVYFILCFIDARLIMST